MNRDRIQLTILALLVLLSASCWAQPITKQIAPGVTLYQEITADPPLVVTAAIVDPATPGVQIKAALGGDTVIEENPTKGRETISAMTARRGAVIGINADFFPYTGDPLNACVIDGQLVSEPEGRRAVVGITKDRKPFCDIPRLDAKLALASGVSRQIDGINRGRETNRVVAYTDIFGASTKIDYKGTDLICTSPDLPVQPGKDMQLTVTEVKLDATNTPIPKGGIVLSAGGPAASFLSANFKAGDSFTVRFDIKSTNGTDWTQVDQAVGGCVWLVNKGEVWLDVAAEGSGESFSTTKHPRTAAGYTADGKLILATVDGRQAISRGISLTDLAGVMKGLGCVTAINLDGGGSTTFSYRGMVLNSTSEGEERAVADGLLVFAPPAEGQPIKLAVTGVTTDVISGQSMQLSLTSGDDAKPLTEDQLASVVWGTNGGVGFVNQSGLFTPVKTRKGSVRAMLGNEVAWVDVAVAAGAAVRLSAQLVADKADPTRAALNVGAYDLNSNRVPNAPMTVTITGGKADAETGTTDEKGAFTTNIIWDAAATEKGAVVTSGTLTAEAELTEAATK